MRTRSLLAFAAALGLSAAALAQTPAPAAESKEKPKAKPAAKNDAARVVVIPAADVKWTDLDAKTAPGVQIADVWGNHAKGAFGAFLKFPAGFNAPLHTHTTDYRIVVISGTYLQTPEGKPEMRLGPGSYLLQPGGNYKHVTACDAGSDCVIFFQSTGKFDIHMVAAPKAGEAKKS